MQNTESEVFGNQNLLQNSESNWQNYKREVNFGGVRCESSADFILPDYMGDVKRLLKSCAEVGVANKFIGSAEVSFLLLVTYRIMYIDSEERLTEATFTSECECSQKIGRGFLDADIDSKVQNLTVRLQGPRKICAKVSIVSDISMCEEDSICEILDLSDAEKLTKKINVHAAEYLKFAEREYAEEIGRLEGVGADEVEIIKCDAKPIIESCRIQDNILTVKGSIDTFCLLRKGEEIIRTEKRIPFEDSMEKPIEDKQCSYIPVAQMGSVNASVNTAVSEDDAGVFYTSVVINMTVLSSVRCDFNEEYSIVCDAFALGMENECSYKTFSYSELKDAHTEKRKISFTERRDETPLRNILDSDAVIKNLKYSVGESDIVAEGEFEYNIAAATVNPGECVSVRGTKAFEEHIKFPSDTVSINNKENLKLRVGSSVCEFSPSFDGENLYLTLTVDFSVCAVENMSEKILTSLNSTQPKEDLGRRVVVYYPTERDTLWSVAKKYSTSVSDIEKNNPTLDFSSDDTERSIYNAGKIIILMK